MLWAGGWRRGDARLRLPQPDPREPHKGGIEALRCDWSKIRSEECLQIAHVGGREVVSHDASLVIQLAPLGVAQHRIDVLQVLEAAMCLLQDEGTESSWLQTMQG